MTRTTHSANPARRVRRTWWSGLITAAAVGSLVLAALPGPAAAAQSGPPSSGQSHAARTTPQAAAMMAALAAAPAGKLTGRGCSGAAGTATCDLYAMATTTTVLGVPVPVWGFSSTGGANSATAPGPLLVVHVGDAVTLTLHNKVPGESVSLALPGQLAVQHDGGAGDDSSGVATDATRTYSFTASRPGTFLYEAGHTPNGARQVAMGLAGALIVLPADGSAYGSAYDDDAVLVMSEIDPAFNADPNAFDMRNFRPRYRLFNGKPYPAADPISTDQGHKVLVRYVNAGAQSHAMTVLGGEQVELAQDGHPMTFTTTVATESVEPGETLDTVVTMPTGPEAKLAVYEPAMHLDNSGQHTADPLQFAFGGMLTFLDTSAPPPSTDGVGPVSTHITLSPNPSDAKGDVTVTADISDASTGGSAVAQAEYVVDDAVTTGPGYGLPMSGAFGAVGVSDVTAKIPAVAAAPCDPPTGVPPVGLNCLSAGKHTVFVRAQDAAGNWGVVGSAILNLPKTGPQTTNGTITSTPTNGAAAITVSTTGDDTAAGGSIIDAEYFLDTAGANGSGTTMTRNRTASVVSEDAAVPAATVKALGEGEHHVLVHSKDSLGLWGPLLDIPFTVDLTGPAVDAAGVGPNPTNGVLTDHSNPGYLVVSAEISDKDAGGASQSNLIDAEAFLNPKSDPGPAGGSGLQLLAVDGKLDSPTEAVYGLIPISQIKPLAEGQQHVYVRGQDAAGNWGAMFGVNLLVDKTAPVLGAPLVGTPNPTNGAANLTLTAPVTEANGLGAAEFFLGTTDPGVGKATRVSVGVVNDNGATNAAATVPLAGVAAGPQRFTLRVQDTAGNWSAPQSTTVTVNRPNTIFGSNFEPTDPAWSTTTGNVSTSGAAAMTVLEPGSTRGLQVTLPGGRANAASYLTDTSPTAESTYHARFAFNPNTLTPGARRVLTIFDARNATASVFSVQYRRIGAQAQLRTVLSRAGGQTTGAWVTLPAGPRTVQLDWRAGPATGANRGSLALTVSGTTPVTLTGNTSALLVETALVGVTAGFSTNNNGPSTGTAFLDSFLSTRNTMP